MYKYNKVINIIKYTTRYINIFFVIIIEQREVAFRKISASILVSCALRYVSQNKHFNKQFFCKTALYGDIVEIYLNFILFEKKNK